MNCSLKYYHHTYSILRIQADKYEYPLFTPILIYATINSIICVIRHMSSYLVQAVTFCAYLDFFIIILFIERLECF